MPNIALDMGMWYQIEYAIGDRYFSAKVRLVGEGKDWLAFLLPGSRGQIINIRESAVRTFRYASMTDEEE
jgi:hypothetical protein